MGIILIIAETQLFGTCSRWQHW